MKRKEEREHKRKKKMTKSERIFKWKKKNSDSE